MYTLYGTLLFFISLISITAQAQETAPDKKEVWITIFIHGTIKPKLALYSIINVMRDHLENSHYRQTLHFLRQDPCLYQTHAIQNVGLQPINRNQQKNYTGACALAELYDAIFSLYNHSSLENIYYTFGWSGLLSTIHRYEDAKKLYKYLTNLVEEYQARNIKPRIRIIAYSHGGNVALNLALVRQHQQHTSPPFSIDELIMLGVPIIKDTEDFIHDCLFKRIYHFYSPGDRAQTKDWVSAQRRSHRCFHAKFLKPLPNNLTQIKLKMTAYQPRSLYMPHGKPKGRTNCTAPGHIELWFFGWTPDWYRKSFPLYPLPTVSFCSYIIDHLCHLTEQYRHMEVNIHPQKEVMIARSFGPKFSRQHHTIPFISQEKLTQLKDQMHQLKPTYNIKEKGELGLAKAIRKARHFRRAYKHAKHKVKRRLRHNKPVPMDNDTNQSIISTVLENQPFSSVAPVMTICAHQSWSAVNAFALNYFLMYDEDMQKHI